jgi:type II secretory pathway pseudopilin PulG
MAAKNYKVFFPSFPFLSKKKLMQAQAGISQVEIIIAVVIVSFVILAISGVINNALQVREYSREQNDLTQQAQFAMQRMVTAVSRTRRLILPLADNPNTAYSESIRDPGVLAVTLDPTLDRDSNGIADADNDGDGLLDEDPTGDLTNDFATGVIGIDDDNDGQVDEAHSGSGPAEDDDDEDGVANEDSWDGKDEDGDGTFDEDTKKDVSHDGQAGLIGIDDDGDSLIDEGDKNDDDEDGSVNEDWLDAVVYFLNGSQLMERMPNINPTDGTDYTEYVIADNVSSLRIERLPLAGKIVDIVDITLVLGNAPAEPISINTRVRVGAGL